MCQNQARCGSGSGVHGAACVSGEYEFAHAEGSPFRQFHCGLTAQPESGGGHGVGSNPGDLAKLHSTRTAIRIACGARPTPAVPVFTYDYYSPEPPLRESGSGAHLQGPRRDAHPHPWSVDDRQRRVRTTLCGFHQITPGSKEEIPRVDVSLRGGFTGLRRPRCGRRPCWPKLARPRCIRGSSDHSPG